MHSLMERGSYLLLEPGMRVRGRDGDLGTVAEVVADENADIFRGFTLSSGIFSANVFVPGERVTAVEGNVVTVDLDHAEAKRLTPPSS
jgi:uncharacterized protein YrrD